MNRSIALAKEGKINENASIRDQHSIIINAPIEEVWEILTNLKEWPSWYGNVKRMEVDEMVEEGTQFKWTLGRVKSISQIQRLARPNTFSWTGKSKWVKRIYVWSLEADENQTIVTVSSSLQGTFTVLVENHQKVYTQLINWLECLKSKSEKG